MKVPDQTYTPGPRGPSHAQPAARALASSIAAFALTSIHHGYGAYVYNTPWRLHAVIISGVLTLLMASLLKVSESLHQPRDAARWGFIAVGLFVAVSFGILEGGYNHLIKDILYFSNCSSELMGRLFPPGLYEMPNDIFFEVTGVLQIIPGVLTGYYSFQLVRQIRSASHLHRKVSLVGALERRSRSSRGVPHMLVTRGRR